MSDQRSAIACFDLNPRPPTDPNSTYQPSVDDDETTAFYDKIYNDYHGIHGYVATVLCCFGLVANACNILVLTRPEMFSTVNMLLTAIAASDSTLMFSYIIYLAHFQLAKFKCLADKYTQAWAVFTVVHADLSVALRACSLWLSVVMAALRSHILSRHQVLLLQSRYIANKKLGYKLIISTVIAVLIMTVPVFVNHTIDPMEVRPPKSGNTTRACPKLAWIVIPPAITLNYDCLIMKLGFWTNGLLLKLVPCILLTYYLIKLIHFVRLHMQVSQAKFGERETINSLKPTTFLLVTILLVTLLCELPNALASLFSGVRSFAYGVMIYKSLGDIFDLLALVNGITSFILYCSMSQMFRETFYNLTCDIRDYFATRGTDYYRRWSTVMFPQSQSAADFQTRHSNLGNGIDTAFQQAITDQDNQGAALPVGPGELQFYDSDDQRNLIPKKNRQMDDKHHRLLESFNLLNTYDQEIDNRHQNFGPSPSTSSDKLLDDQFEKKKGKKLGKKQSKNSSLPMFEYTNLNSLNLVQTKLSHLGSSLPSPPTMNDLEANRLDEDDDGDHDEKRILPGSYPRFDK